MLILVVAAAVPSWVWAALLMTLFVLVSAATMWLTRYPLRDLGPGRDEQDDELASDDIETGVGHE